MSRMILRSRNLFQTLEFGIERLLPHAHLVLLAVALLVGLLTVADFGESWDERNLREYGEYGLAAYGEVLQGRLPASIDSFLGNYGPAVFMLAAGLAHLFGGPVSGGPVVVWHTLYFLTFLVGAWFMHSLARRWLNRVSSLGVMLLFLAQPLLWGHAFINPKDTPFLTLFLASSCLGFWAVDRTDRRWQRFLSLLMAAAVLGLTISVRSGGPLAGVFVFAYAAWRLRRKAIAWILLYALGAIVVMYLTWPFLWTAPLTHLYESVRVMSSFPFYPRTQFDGAYYPGDGLPWFYVPAIYGMQLTEPAVLLFCIGLGTAITQVIRRSDVTGTRAPVLFLFFCWTVLPVLAIRLVGGTLYDNARQLLFLLPPVFVLIGVALESLQRLVARPVFMLLCIGLLALPGTLAAYRLHPYEYVYYNSLVGGTRGASGRFEMDYLGTSYSQIRAWLSKNVPLGSRLWIPGGPTYLVTSGLRPDIQAVCLAEEECGADYDYYVALARWRAERRCRGARTVYEVGRQGATFSVVKELPDGRQCR